MSEFDRVIHDQEIAKLSAEGKWLKLISWCGDIINYANYLDRMNREFQNQADNNPVVTVYRRYGEKLELPVHYWHLVPRRLDEAHFGVKDLYVIFPLDSRVLDANKKYRLVLLQKISEQEESEYFIITANSFKSLGNLPPEYDIRPTIEQAIQQLDQPPVIDTSISDEDLTIAQDLRDIICEQAFGFGIDSLPPLTETD
jgi:hypothetical protein